MKMKRVKCECCRRSFQDKDIEFSLCQECIELLRKVPDFGDHVDVYVSQAIKHAKMDEEVRLILKIMWSRICSRQF